MTKRGRVRFSRHFVSSIRERTEDGKPKRTYYVVFWTQPWHRYVVYRLYHSAWERATHRIWRKLERLVPNRTIPFSNAQDIRCHGLSRKGRKTVADIEVSQEVCNQIGSGGAW